jgi:hypothetical protein
MIPRRFEAVLFGFVLSGLMSFIVAGMSTVVGHGAGIGFPALWARSWFTAWVLAFPVVVLVGPLARRLVQRLLRPD